MELESKEDYQVVELEEAAAACIGDSSAMRVYSPRLAVTSTRSCLRLSGLFFFFFFKFNGPQNDIAKLDSVLL